MTPAHAATAPGERHLFSGIGLRFLGEALILPTGLITAAFLSRTFGPNGYGLITLCIVIVSWLEWGINSVLARSAIHYVATKEDWQPAAGKIVQWHLILSLLAAAALGFAAPHIAQALNQPELRSLLRLLAIDIPFFCVGNAHYNLLVARQRYLPCAILSSVRSLARLAFIVAFVLGGLGISGVLWGLIGSSIATLIGCRFYVRPSFLKPLRVPMPDFWNAATWLFGYALCLRFFEKIDLLILKYLGGSVEEAGYYGAAQNLCHILNLLALSTAPLLLSTLTTAFQKNNLRLVKSICKKGGFFLLLLFPFVCLAAQFSDPLTLFVYNPSFLPASGVMKILIFGSFAMMLFSIATAIWTAAGGAKQTFFLMATLLPAMLFCQFTFIPRWGMAGAAAATTLITAIGAGIAFWRALRLVYIRGEQHD